MAYSGVLDDVKTCVNLGIPKRVPVFAISEPFDVRICGLTHAEYTQDVDKMVKCRIEAIKKFDYDWSIGWPDDYIEFEPLGVKLKGEEDIPLAAYEYPPASWDTLKHLKIPNFQNDVRMPGFLEVIKKIKKELGDTICLTGRVAAPFSSVSLLYGVDKGLSLLYEEPELFKKTMGFFVELTVEWGKAQIRAGANALWLGDCVACSGFISSKFYAEFAFKAASEVMKALKKEKAFVFYHAGESSLSHLELMADLGPSALSIGGKIDIKKAKETVGKRVCLLGNIHGIATLQQGNPDYVERETIRIMEAGKKNGGYIFNSEEGIPRETPEENVTAMIKTARKHSFYKKE